MKTHSIDQEENIDRLTRCLAFIKDNPTHRFPAGWVDGVKNEARTLGLLPPLPAWRNCANRMKDGPDYEKLILIRQERDGIYD